MGQRNTGASAIAMRSIRIWSGLFLLAFVTSHLMNLSLGLISTEAMDAARPYLSGLWAGPILGSLMLLAMLSHYFLGLWTIYRRPTLRTNAQDIIQLASGVIIVPLLATHVISISTMSRLGIDYGYSQAIKFFWLGNPSLGLLQVTVLSVVWIHGCAGLFTWLRAKEGARHALVWLYPLAVAIPVIALMGYAEAGRRVLVAANPEQIAGTAGASAGYSYAAPKPEAPAADGYSYAAPTVNAPADNGYSYSAPAAPTEGGYSYDTTSATTNATPPTEAPKKIPFKLIKQITSQVITWSIVLAALAFIAREIRLMIQKTQKVILRRGDGRDVHTTSALSMLDSFRAHNQPHASLCEGRGRCGTCAVTIRATEFPLPEPSLLELKTLNRINAPEGARLACQLTPSGGRVEVDPLYPADYSFHDIDDDPASHDATTDEVTA